MKSGPYRYWGHVDPRERQKPAVRAEVPAATTDTTTATLRIYDPIDSYGDFWGLSAKEFAAALDTLDSSVTDLHLHVNSPGGEVFEGLAILNVLRAHPANVTVFVDGLAASIASVIAVGGADELVMGRNSELMVHSAWGICIGNAVDMRELADTLDRVSDNIASVYADKAGGSVADWRVPMLAETWYSAQEAVDAGLADRVAPVAKAATQDRFDLSVFSYAGRNAAPPPAPPMPEAPSGRLSVADVRKAEDLPAADGGRARRLRQRQQAARTGLHR